LNEAKPKNNKVNAKVEQFRERVLERLNEYFDYFIETD
jgi:hypothetical protein